MRGTSARAMERNCDEAPAGPGHALLCAGPVAQRARASPCASSSRDSFGGFLDNIRRPTGAASRIVRPAYDKFEIHFRCGIAAWTTAVNQNSQEQGRLAARAGGRPAAGHADQARPTPPRCSTAWRCASVTDHQRDTRAPGAAIQITWDGRQVLKAYY
ncbi:MAG: hypothetical protein ACLU9S_10070 [Oscillospiraceae bacterium]